MGGCSLVLEASLIGIIVKNSISFENVGTVVCVFCGAHTDIISHPAGHNLTSHVQKMNTLGLFSSTVFLLISFFKFS